LSTDQNKAVVRRFITEVLADGNADVIDELLAPNYVSHGTSHTSDLAHFKATASVVRAIAPQRSCEIEDLVAEGDAVVARVTYEMTLTDGKKVSARGLTYYRLANGMIVEDEPISTPDLPQELSAQMPRTAGR